MMNEEDGEIHEKRSEEKGGDTHPPIPVVDTSESEEEGPKGTEQGKEAATLNHISRLDRVKKWLSQITVAEAGMLLLTVAIAWSSIVYTKYAKRQWNVMGGQLTEMQGANRLARQQLVGTQAAVIVFNETRWNPTTRTLTFSLSNTGAVTGTITSFTANVQRKTLPDQKPIGQGVPIEFENREIGKTSNYILEKGLPWPLPEVKDQNLWPGKEIATIEGQYTYSNGFGDALSHKFCVLWLPTWNLQVPIPNGGGGAEEDGPEPTKIALSNRGRMNFLDSRNTWKT
jgi:hypothetical protein